MKALRWLLMGALVTSAVQSLAAPVNYRLEVRGMICAFCAYNTAKHLGALTGVAADSVEVDLDKGVVRLRSDRPLAREEAAKIVEQAGFELLGITHLAESAAPPRLSPSPEPVVRLQLDPRRLSEGVLNPLLESFGGLVVAQGGRLDVKGPPSLEMRILKPLLMGRRTTIPVTFEPAAGGDAVAVEWRKPADR